MKIIAKDNYDRDDVSDVLVAENIKAPTQGYHMTNALNDKCGSGPDAGKFFLLVQDDYVLHVYDPNK